MNRRVVIGQNINCEGGLDSPIQGDLLKGGERKAEEISLDNRDSGEGSHSGSHVSETTVEVQKRNRRKLLKLQ